MPASREDTLQEMHPAGSMVRLRRERSALSAFTVNLAYNLEPVYSIAFAAVLFGELRELDWSFWLGISLIIISVLIQTVRVGKRGLTASDA